MNSKHFCSSQYLFGKRNYDKKHKIFQFYVHFQHFDVIKIWKDLVGFNKIKFGKISQ